MPAKTGTSHALAAFVSMIVGTTISKYVWAHLPPLARAGESVSDLLAAAVGVSLPRPVSGSLLFILGLAFVWGLIYHLARH